MDSLRLVQSIIADVSAEKDLLYDKLARTLNNLDLEADPKSVVKGFFQEIAHLDKTQEIALYIESEIRTSVSKRTSQDEAEKEEANPEGDKEDSQEN